MKKSPQQKYVLPVGITDLKRMTMLGDIYMPDCQQFLLQNGLCAGMTVADVACGPGNVSVWLSAQVGSSGSVVAIDNSEAQLSILQQRIAEKHLHNIIPRQLDIDDITQVSERFDLIFCRFILMHLLDPFAIIKKLRDCLKPNGRLILAEVDNATWFSYPEHAGLQQELQLLREAWQRDGKDAYIGPKLYGYLRAANFQSVQVRIAQPVLTGENRSYLLLRSQTLSNIFLAHNLISASDLAAIQASLQEMIANEDYLLAAAKMYLVSGCR